MKITVRIDTNACILAANCVGVAPDIFHIGDAPTVELLNDKGEAHGTEVTLDATPHQTELIEEAAEACPTRAILVTQHS